MCSDYESEAETANVHVLNHDAEIMNHGSKTEARPEQWIWRTPPLQVDRRTGS